MSTDSAAQPDQRFYDSPFFEIKRKMDLLLLLGQLLMENGANTNQILRDMMRAASYMGIPREYIHIHISYTTLMLNINDGDRSYTIFRKTLRHGVNMTTLSVLSKLTWKALDNDYSLDEFEERLNTISKTPPRYPQLLAAAGAGFACGAFAILFGSNILTAWITTFCAMFGFYVRNVCRHYQMNIYLCITLASFCATLPALLISSFFPGDTVLYAGISAALFMIPGVPLINAVDDMINNHIVSGITRATHTLLTVSSMAAGIGMALYFDKTSTFTHLSITPQSLYPLQIGGAIVGAMGFSIIFNIPKRLLPVVAIGGAISVFIRNSLIVFAGFSPVGASFFAAAVISVIAMRAAKQFRTAPLVLAIPSVIPMIPGVLLYRFLFGILTINSLNADNFMFVLRSGITGVLIIVCLAVGVSIPHILASGYLDRAKERRLQHLLNRRDAA